MLFKASAPGSLMLLGEYAVLHDKPAVVCAVNKRIVVELKPRTDRNIYISSSLHGDYQTTVDELKIEKPFQFVLATLKHFQDRMKRGCDLHISSDFSDTLGLGSSAAVTVASLAALVTWQERRMTPLEMVRMGKNIVRSVQQIGSGADIAAAVLGGMVAYQTCPLMAEKLDCAIPLSVWYSGFKTPTVDAIKQVQANFAKRPELFRYVINSIGQCAVDGIHMLRKQDISSFAEVMNIQQGLMEALGVGMPVLRKMIDTLREQTSISAAKISGSGLGDCIVGLGESKGDIMNINGVQQIPVSISAQGVECEKN